MMSFSHDMKIYIYDKDDGQVKKKEEKKLPYSVRDRRENIDHFTLTMVTEEERGFLFIETYRKI